MVSMLWGGHERRGADGWRADSWMDGWTNTVKIFEGRNIIPTTFYGKLILKIKGTKSARNVDKVTVLYLCTHSDNALYL